VTSRKPPSQRDSQYVLQRMSRTLQSMAPGTMGGRVANAAPIDADGSGGLLPLLDAVASGTDGGLATRTEVSYTTADLGVNVLEKGTVEMSTAYQVIYIVTDIPARVRLYVNATNQDRDGDRPITYDPYPGLGIFMDYLTAPELLAAPVIPPAAGAIFDPDQGVAVPITVTSIYGGAVTVTLTYFAIE
jgi:hypothetical protein